MALSLERALLVRQRTLAFTRKPKIQAQLKAFFSYLDQHKKDPDLQFTAYAALTSTDVVIADAACRLFAVYIEKPSASTVTAFFKLTNHASTGSATASDITQIALTNDIILLQYGDGLAMSAGVTLLSHTTADGSSGSVAADRPNGFVIVGAP